MTVRSLTAKERILLHLFDYARFEEAYEAPLQVTQSAIADAVGILLPHFAQYAKPLLAEGLLSERTGHVRRQSRRRKLYFLTPAGRQRAASLRTSLFQEEVAYRSGGTVAPIPLARVYQEERRGTPLLDLLRELEAKGEIGDTAPNVGPALVDRSGEAPPVERFYGRERELAEALEALSGRPIVVVTGIAGIGKTTFAAKVATALRGRRSLFWRQVRPWDTAIDLAVPLGEFLHALGRTSLRAGLKDREEGLGTVEDRLAADLADSGCLLVFDDIHDASADALGFLGRLFRALRRQRGASGLFLSRKVPDLYSRREVVVEGTVAEIALPGLDPGSSASLLSDLGVAGPIQEDLVSISAGSPLFLTLLASGGSRQRPAERWATLEAYIAEQIEPALSPEEREVLALASLYEVPVPQDGLLLGSRAGTKDVIALVRRGLLERREGERFLAHGTIREYFRRGLASGTREALVARTVPWLLRVAEEEASQGRPEDAIPFVQNAVEIDPDPRRRVLSLGELGKLRVYAGDDEDAIAAFRLALEGTDDPKERARFHEKIALCLGAQMRLEEADAELAKGFELVSPEPSLERGWLHYRRAAVLAERQDYEEAREEVDQARGWILLVPEDRRREDLRASLAMVSGYLYLEDPRLADPIRAEADFRDAIAIYDAIGDAQGPSLATTELGRAALTDGRPDDALSAFERSASLADRIGDLPARIEAEMWKGRVLSEYRGDHDAAEAIYARTFAAAKEKRLPQFLMWHFDLFADLYLRQGRPEEARESLAHFLEAIRHRGNVAQRVRTLARMVRLCAACRDGEAASGYVRDAESLVEGSATNASRSALSWARASVLAHRGDREGALRAFEGAFDDAPATEPRRAELLLEWGRCLAEDGQRDAARARFEEAAAEAARWGLKPLEELARRALAGEREPRPRAPSTKKRAG